MQKKDNIERLAKKFREYNNSIVKTVSNVKENAEKNIDNALKDINKRLDELSNKYESYKKKCTVPVENNITREECIDIINKNINKYKGLEVSTEEPTPEEIEEARVWSECHENGKVCFEWDKENHIITVHFGRNGFGLTTELLEIGKFVEKLSEKAHVYLSEPFFDTIDDVYDFKIEYEYK